MSPGPGKWCTAQDLHFVADCFGQARNFPSLTHLCIASQKRVYQWENHTQGGLQISAKFSELQTALRQGDHIGRYCRWHAWYAHGPVAILHDTSSRLDAKGLSSDVLLKEAGWDDTKPDQNGKRARFVRKNFQKCVKNAIARKCFRNTPVERIRSKLSRWNLFGIPNHTANRVAMAFQHLRDLVPPRVCAAVWKTMWNGWTTARRFQQCKPCVFGCGSMCNADSIEHYARCTITIDSARNFVGLRRSHYSTWLGDFVVLGLNHGKVDGRTLTLRAIVVYAVMRATNLLRHHPAIGDNVATDMVQQFAKEAVRGHGKASAVLDGAVWRAA